MCPASASCVNWRQVMIVSSTTMVVLVGAQKKMPAFIKIKSQMDNDKEDKYHAVAMQLNLLLSGTSMMHLQLIILLQKCATK